jgi:hypothetical protein
MSLAPAPVGSDPSDHVVYGLGLRSDLPLDNALATTLIAPDVSIRFASLDALIEASPARVLLHEDPRRDAFGVSPLQVSTVGESTLFEYADSTRFLIDDSASHVTCESAPGESDENTIVYLLGQIMAFVLRQRGVVSLHGSAAVIDGRAATFLGDPGTGKSTFAAALARDGHPLLSDDLLALRPAASETDIAPGYTGAKLWPDAADQLGADDAAPILPHSRYWTAWDKRFLDLRAGGFERHARPIGAVFLLADRHDGPEPQLERLRGHAALTALMAHVSVGYLPGDQALQRELRVLSQVAATVPVWRLGPVTDLRQMSRNLAAVLRVTRAGATSAGS